MLGSQRKILYFFICILTIHLFSGQNLLAQAQHDSGFFLRYLGGFGIAQVTDAVNNPTTGTAFRTSLALGAFVSKNFALHLGPEYTQSSNIKYEGNVDQPLRGGSYTYYSLNSGLSYFFTNVSLYFSLEGRFLLGGDYELKGALTETQADGSQTLLETRDVKGKFTDEEERLGIGLIIGTEEWLLSNDIGLGMAIMYSFDRARRHIFYGFTFSLCYN